MRVEAACRERTCPFCGSESDAPALEAMAKRDFLMTSKVPVLEAELRTKLERWREQFGFTPAEANFALEIAKGDGRQAAADRLGITLGTARSHLSAVFDKAGVRRQAELVRLLLRT
jgi:DNA-binding CsgD family transcriptional regulator